MNRFLALCALALAAPLAAQQSADRPHAVPVDRPPTLPAPIASFGAARSGDHVYVFGGHVGRAHRHSRENVVGDFRRLDLRGGGGWEQLPGGPPLQGTALVAGPKGRLFRVGGMTAHNAPGEPEDMHSTASVQVFDPATGAWQEFVPLPQPRSSHDAIVVDGVLYVIGGWCLSGSGDGRWHESALRCDLRAAEPRWEPLPAPPFIRRACAVAGFGPEVVMIGGIDEVGVAAECSIYDPRTRTWRGGPDLPEPGFGAAAVGIEDAVYTSSIDGELRVLRPGASAWAPAGRLALPRFFHRFVRAAGESALLAIGGAGRGGHLRACEIVPLAGSAVPRVQEWMVASDGAARQRAAVVVDRDRIHLFGGNRGGEGDAFAPERFVDEVCRVSLATMASEVVGELPAARQSMVAVGWDDGRHLLLGGLGPDADGVVRSHADAFAVDARTAAVERAAVTLPDRRTQFQAVPYGGRVWVFGGIDFTPGTGEATRPLDVLVLDPGVEGAKFEPSGIRLPRPRRSFGAAVLGSKVWLVGGLGDGFDPVTECDVFDFETQQWSEGPPPPKAWVSAQVRALGGRIHVACGGTMSGRRFVEDRALWAFEPSTGWTELLGELPFGVRHVTMLAHRDRLWFVDPTESGRIALRALVPPSCAGIAEASMGR